MDNPLGANWEERAAQCSKRWRLTDLVWLPNVGTARIAFCNCDSCRAVLKVSVEQNMVAIEAKALCHFGSRICPAVLEVSEDLDALLIERVDMVEDLSARYPDPIGEVDVWIPFFREVEKNRSIPEGFPTLAKYAEVFDRILSMSISPDVAKIMLRGRDRQAILMGSASENRLLHGDMHHFNLLRDSTNRWRLIDPHGVVGHPYYELGAFLRNPWGACYQEPGVRQRLFDRVEVLSERLCFPAAIVAEYGFYGAAFSIAWSLEDESGDIDGQVAMAEACLSLVDSSI